MKHLLLILVLLSTSCQQVQEYVQAVTDTGIVAGSATIGAVVAGAPGAFVGASISHLLVENVQQKVQYIDRIEYKDRFVPQSPTLGLFLSQFWVWLVGISVVILFINPKWFVTIPSWILRRIRETIRSSSES